MPAVEAQELEVLKALLHPYTRALTEMEATRARFKASVDAHVGQETTYQARLPDDHILLTPIPAEIWYKIREIVDGNG